MKCTFDELINYLKIGHEVDFSYKGDKYAISSDSNGCYLAKYGDTSFLQEFTSYLELINNASIDLKKLTELWDKVDIEIIY